MLVSRDSDMINNNLNTPIDSLMQPSDDVGDPMVPLFNLSNVQSRMDSLQHFLCRSLTSKSVIGKHQMDLVSNEISSAIHQIIVNGSALLACTQSPNPKQPIFASGSEQINSKVPNYFKKTVTFPKVELVEVDDDGFDDEWEIIELDAVELLEKHIHFCEYCGKGFKRDANLRMHMRAHGEQFKSLEALFKPGKRVEKRKRTRFSCPFVGCNRNKKHKKFRPLKSVICVRNHFKRSHCPKLYWCELCNKKSFSVVSDLKCHMKHCGERRWKCSCGTSFSRKNKLFGHLALFEGHMPAVEEDEKGKGVVSMAEDEVVYGDSMMEMGANCLGNGLFEGWLEGFDYIEDHCLQDLLGTPNSSCSADGMMEF